MKYNDKYDDIINLPHHVSTKHPQMSIEARSAQFAPFAALTGYEDEVNETARLTNKKVDIDEETKIILNEKLEIIKEKIELKPKVTFTYFVPDLKKEGGKYVTVTDNIKRIDNYSKVIILENKSIIPILDIINIEGDILKNFI